MIEWSGRLRAELANCLRAIWPAYLLASLLILWGLTWSLPNNPHVGESFHADENAVADGIEHIQFPGYNPHVFNWGTALIYQAYFFKRLLSIGHLIWIGRSEEILIGRLLVWLYALGALTCLYLLCRELFDEWTARLAALLLAVMPGFIINSHYFKMDIPMAFWLCATLLAGYRLVATGNAHYVYALGLLTGYAISTKYNAVAVIPAGVVCIALSSPVVRKVRSFLIYGVCVIMSFLIGTPRVLPDPREFLDTLHWATGIGRTMWPVAIVRGPAWADYLTRIVPLSMTFPLALAAGIAIIWLTVKRSRMMLPILAFLAAYVYLLGTDNVRLMRYTVPLLPLAALAVAAAIGELRKTGPLGRSAGVAGAALLIAYALVFTASFVRVMTEQDPRIQASWWIAGHVPRDLPFPVSTSHYLGAPQIQLWGFTRLDVGADLEQLRLARSDYLAVSELITQKYDGALEHYPAVKQFFEYIDANYKEVARFENSQRLLGIDSKYGLVITSDWLNPNPRITIFRRRNPTASQAHSLAGPEDKRRALSALDR